MEIHLPRGKGDNPQRGQSEFLQAGRLHRNFTMWKAPWEFLKSQGKRKREQDREGESSSREGLSAVTEVLQGLGAGLGRLIAWLCGTSLKKLALLVAVLIAFAYYLCLFFVGGVGKDWRQLPQDWRSSWLPDTDRVANPLNPADTQILNITGNVTTEKADERHSEPIWIGDVPQDEGDSNYKLVSAASMLPKADKVETGGEDAFSITKTNWVGVADGVGGWVNSGVDAGIYSRELMANCKAIALALKTTGKPSGALARAHRRTLSRVSSTAILAMIRNKTLHVSNVGDSGFLLIRKGECVARSTPMLHNFNFPLQISRDHYEVPTEYELDVEKGDVIILGSDGLFDNLFESKIVEVVVAFKEGHGAGPKELAKLLATLAQHASKSKRGQTPFSTGARALGLYFRGGKEDDITVVVSFVTQAPSPETSAGLAVESEPSSNRRPH